MAKNYEEQAREILNGASREYESVRANRNLSDNGKARHLAKIYTRTKKTVDGLQQTAEREKVQRHNSLEKQLYGLPDNADASTVIAYRDALDRADRLTQSRNPERDAIALVNRSINAGDTTLARAVLATAYEHQWVDTINTYLEHNENLQSQVQELWDLKSGADTLIAWSFITSKPRELDRISDTRVDEMAREGEADDLSQMSAVDLARMI